VASWFTPGVSSSMKITRTIGKNLKRSIISAARGLRGGGVENRNRKKPMMILHEKVVSSLSFKQKSISCRGKTRGKTLLGEKKRTFQGSEGKEKVPPAIAANSKEDTDISLSSLGGSQIENLR